MTDRIPAEAIEPASTPDRRVLTSLDGVTEWTPGGGGVLVADTLPAASSAADQLLVLRSGTATADAMLGADGLHPSLAGMTHLADAYVDALATAGKTPSAGTPVYAYGNSWTSDNTYVSAGQKAIEQLVTRLGLGTLNNRAVGGYRIGDVATRAISGAPFVAGTTGLAFFQAGVNDLADTDDATRRAAITNYLRTIMAVMSAAERIEESAFTFSSGWTLNTFALSSGGKNRGTGTEGATASINITTPGDYYLLSHTPTSGAAGVFTVTQGAATLATIDMQGQGAGSVTISTHGPLVAKIPGVEAGTLTFTFSRAGRGTVEGWIDALLRMSPTPPTILAVKPVDVLEASRQKPALLAAIRDAYDTVAAEFGAHVVVCDPLPGWEPDGFVSDPGADPELWFSDGADWKRPSAAGGPGGSTPTASDVTVSPTGSIAATNVQAALVELDSEKIPTSQKGTANGIATLGADGKVPAGQLPSGTAGTAAGTSFAPTTGIAATNVQAAIEELAAETVPTAAVGVPSGVASLGADGKVPSSQLPASSGSGGSTGKDQRWTVRSGQTSIDEFNDDTQDAAWVRVDGAAAPAGNVTWTEGADVISALNNGGDAAAGIHGLMRPIGTPMAVGDAFIVGAQVFGRLATDFVMSGILLADGVAFGSGNQVAGMHYTGAGGTETRIFPLTGYNAAGTASTTIFTMPGMLVYLRLVMVAANTWRLDVSPDGVSWLKGSNLAKTLTPTHVGLMSSSWGTATKHIASYEFLRRVAGVS